MLVLLSKIEGETGLGVWDSKSEFRWWYEHTTNFTGSWWILVGNLDA
jgi:hypothetical protein